MTQRTVIRVVVRLLAGVGVVALIAVAAASMRGSARDSMTAYACEWHLISESTCYPDDGRPNLFTDAVNEMAIKSELEKELAQIIADQERIKAEKHDWDKNSQASDLDVQQAFIVGCERDKLARMQDGKDVSSWDCRKGSAVR